MDFVQNKYFDRNQALYAGQVADWGSLQQSDMRAYVREEVLYAGRGAVKGAANDWIGSDHVTTPYAVKAPVASGSPSVEADFVGIVLLSNGMADDGSGNVGGTRTKGICTIAERFSGMIVGAEIPAGVTCAHDDPVYLILATGKFHNAAAAGRILLPDLFWYGTNVGPAAVTGVAPTIGRIKMSSRGATGATGPQGPQGEPG